MLNRVGFLRHEYSIENLDQILGLFASLMTKSGATPRVDPPDSEPPPRSASR